MRSISAQRLSASRIISDRLVVFQPRGFLLCSTPFGITDYIGIALRRSTAGLRVVLNAFRHHGLYRYLGLLCLGRPCLCSTPFGITDYIGRRRRHARRAQPGVLNAFRHHGLYRISSARPWTLPTTVLNAFRHHGLYRVGDRVESPAAKVCSTPFGITDYIGCQPSPRFLFGSICAQRLSASRIISAVIPNSWSEWMNDACAQRLSASRIISAASQR